MGFLSPLDAAILAPAAILGLLGLWLGLGRSLVAWPMRWLVPLFGALAAALPAALSLATSGATADLLSLDAAATAALAVIAFAVALLLLAMFMRNLKERMRFWTASRGVGVMERIYGGIFGVACGLLLAAIPYALYASLQPDSRKHPDWVHQSIVMQYLSGASEAVKSAVSAYLPQAGRPRR
jgi:uncharacterized membrane protein required for colicin V production